jgi:hypothetical protein
VVDNTAALTATAAVTLCVSEPEEPWRVMLVFPTAAVGPAVTVSCCSEPGAMDKVIGVTVTPAAREPTVRLTLPEKPFTGEVVMSIACAEPPEVSVTAKGAIARVKSAADVELLLELGVEPLPLLHPAKTVTREIAHRKAIRDCIDQLLLYLSRIRFC